jgi:hypothetical protein
MGRISAFVLAYNEAEKIKAAIETLLWADEIVLVDSHSTDGTAQIAESLGARVVQVPFNGFGDLRNRAVEACRYEWIFSLDSDERCTEAVRDEILSLVSGSPQHDAYRVPRRNYMMGRRIRGSGWYPNFRQPQLFRRGTMRYTLEPVHEGYELLSGKPLGTLPQCHLAIPLPRFRRGHPQDESLFVPRGAETRAQARLHGGRILACGLGLLETLRRQGRLYRRLGGLRDRVRLF